LAGKQHTEPVNRHSLVCFARDGGPSGVCGSGRDDEGFEASGQLGPGEAAHLKFDPAGSGQVAVGHMGDAHSDPSRRSPHSGAGCERLPPVPGTVVFVHAHPDDEALLTGGTIARLAASGRRVVLVTATDGAEGLTSADVKSESTLARIRSGELAKSAAALGVARSIQLGYPDSGMEGDASAGSAGTFARTPVGEVADRLAAILRAEGASVVVGYDHNGGYRHPDHLQVHRATLQAARIAGTPRYLEATLPREPLARAASLAHSLRWLVPQLGGLDPNVWWHSFTPRSQITDAVDVRPFLTAKRAALRAHNSQATADDGFRTIDVLLRLPDCLFARLMGTEWFVRADPRESIRGLPRPLGGSR